MCAGLKHFAATLMVSAPASSVFSSTARMPKPDSLLLLQQFADLQPRLRLSGPPNRLSAQTE